MNTEKDFLLDYKLEDFERPSVTTDIVILTMRSEKEDSYRHNPKNRLSLLLIKRGEHPFKDSWALPGGFVKPDETVEECALREIKEETNVSPTALLPTGVFSEIGRDPRGWIISNAFASVISSDSTEIIGGDDAAEARWFDLDFTEGDDGVYELNLTSGDIRLNALVKESKRLFDIPEMEIIESGSLAFDHAKIIAVSLLMLRTQAQKTETLFDFLPEEFTLAELQGVYETIMNISVLTANFRRKMADYVVETDKMTTGAGHRPAKLFRRK